MQSQQFTANGAGAAPRDMFRELGKLARLASEALDASSTLLARAQALVRTHLGESEQLVASLGMMPPQLDGAEASLIAAARQLMLSSAETVLGVRALIGGESLAERYRWCEKSAGPTMVELHVHLDEMVHWGPRRPSCSRSRRLKSSRWSADF